MMFVTTVWSQTAGPGEEDLDRGRRDSCSRVRDEETGGFVQRETGGTSNILVENAGIITTEVN